MSANPLCEAAPDETRVAGSGAIKLTRERLVKEVGQDPEFEAKNPHEEEKEESDGQEHKHDDQKGHAYVPTAVDAGRRCEPQT